MNGEGKITTSHRDRIAIVYLRQSTMLQVRDHAESTMRQYALADLARELGWPSENVVVIDADLGVSGQFGTVREGFREVVSRVCLGEVGAVFGLEVSRLARSSAEFARLLELARLTDTLVIDADGIYDLADINDQLLLGLKGSMSQAELHLLAGRLQGARRAAAARGDLGVPLPVGLVYDADGQIALDADEEIRAAVADVFAEFEASGSAFGVMKAFKDRAFPLRAFGGIWAGQVRWGRLTHSRAVAVLSNPSYAGAYVWGRHRTARKVQPDGTVVTTHRAVPRAEWKVLILDHHEGYITWDRYVEIEAKLAANCTYSGARPAREGAPLCQGVITCGSCGSPIGTRYKGRGHYPCYVCSGHRKGARTIECRSVASWIIDKAVTQLVLTSLTGPQIQLALDAAEQVTDRHTRAHRAAELAVERARYQAQRAERAFDQADPDNRLVTRTLESRWETKLAALAEAEHALETVRQTRTPLPDRARLEQLAADLPRLWHAPSTTNRDRKRLLRAVIADVTLMPDTGDGTVSIGVRWHTGATDLITTNRRRPDRTPPPALELARKLGPIATDQELADALNAAGHRTGKGYSYTARSAQWLRRAFEIPAPWSPQGEEITLPQAAERLGISTGPLYYWVKQGLVPARKTSRGRTSRWCIPWTPENEAACRQQVADSVHLKPKAQLSTSGGAV
ncbi:recombinase family protein [Streptomyces sp. 4.24]|uniref:recombinase family protein n=1 Tax=Streptomyces tritrimontium TaxID=3406573 RepID=UPI003BB54EAA